MPICSLSGVQLTAVHAVVPSTRISFLEETELYGGQVAAMERLAAVLGLGERRVVTGQQTALDLCEIAARELLCAQSFPVEAIDALIFVTQTPDHFQPGNAPLLHGRLGCVPDCAALDLNLGCAGYIFGLWQASCLIASGGCRNILLLCGDTLSRCTNPGDKSVHPLFGDAGTATLLQAVPAAGPTWFLLRTDGQRADAIRIPSGAFRQRATSTAETVDEDGNRRTEGDLHMNGAEVFSFSIRAAPEAVEGIWRASQVGAEQVDRYIFHQANQYIVSNIARRLKLPKEKVPVESFRKYGNTSGASIPLTLAHSLQQQPPTRVEKHLLCGFGVGLSWASALLDLPVGVTGSIHET